MIGQPGPLVGFNDHVIRLLGIAYHEVQAHHRDFQRARRSHRRIGQHRVQAFGDVFQGATGMQVGRATHRQALAGGQHVVIAVPGTVQGTFGLVVQRDAAFATGRRLAPAALRLDQLTNAVLAVTDHLGRVANRRRHHFIADHQNA